MALKSGQLSGLDVPEDTYRGIQHWLGTRTTSPDRPDRYRYNPYAPDTPSQRHGKNPTPTMTAVGMLMRMYSGWRRDQPSNAIGRRLLAQVPAPNGHQKTPRSAMPITGITLRRSCSTWVATIGTSGIAQLNPLLLDSQIKDGPDGRQLGPNSSRSLIAGARTPDGSTSPQ